MVVDKVPGTGGERRREDRRREIWRVAEALVAALEETWVPSETAVPLTFLQVRELAGRAFDAGIALGTFAKEHSLGEGSTSSSSGPAPPPPPPPPPPAPAPEETPAPKERPFAAAFARRADEDWAGVAGDGVDPGRPVGPQRQRCWGCGEENPDHPGRECPGRAPGFGVPLWSDGASASAAASPPPPSSQVPVGLIIPVTQVGSWGKKTVPLGEQAKLAAVTEVPPEPPDEGSRYYAGFQPSGARGVYHGVWRNVLIATPAGFRARGFGEDRQAELEARVWLASYGHTGAAQAPVIFC